MFARAASSAAFGRRYFFRTALAAAALLSAADFNFDSVIGAASAVSKAPTALNLTARNVWQGSGLRHIRGREDNGKPRLRAHFHPNDYGPFVIDLHGRHNVPVCHAPS